MFTNLTIDLLGTGLSSIVTNIYGRPMGKQWLRPLDSLHCSLGALLRIQPKKSILGTKHGSTSCMCTAYAQCFSNTSYPESIGLISVN